MLNIKRCILDRECPSKHLRRIFASRSIISIASQKRSVSFFLGSVSSATMRAFCSVKYRSRNFGTISLNFLQSDSMVLLIVYDHQTAPINEFILKDELRFQALSRRNPELLLS